MARRTALSGLTTWLVRLDVGVSHGRPTIRRPRQGRAFPSHAQARGHLLAILRASPGEQLALDDWRDVYNLYRSHKSSRQPAASARYQPSRLNYPETLPSIGYPASVEVRIMSHQCKVLFRGRRLFIGEGFRDEAIALKAIGDGTWNIYDCDQ
jgi:hypothetical protein